MGAVQAEQVGFGIGGEALVGVRQGLRPALAPRRVLGLGGEQAGAAAVGRADEGPPLGRSPEALPDFGAQRLGVQRAARVGPRGEDGLVQRANGFGRAHVPGGVVGRAALAEALVELGGGELLGGGDLEERPGR
ncbi:MAG: hypothetical protein ACK559_05805, partial [bacterium]